MKIWFLCLTVSLATTAHAFEVREIPAPAVAGAMGSALTTGPDGTVYLSWLEPAGTGTTALKFAAFDTAHNRWGDARLIAQGKNWIINWADFPSFSVQAEGRMTAAWPVANPASGAGMGLYHALFSVSGDGGATWSVPQPVSAESRINEFTTLQPDHDGHVLALWLDSRHRATNGDRQSLYARFLDRDGPDMLVDDAVCDCCQIAATLTPEGVLIAYRGRTKDEVRDNRLALWSHGAWSQPRALHPDRWTITGCPVNGPQLATRGHQVAATWFTAARSQPRVFAKLSSDGGETFGEPLRLDLGIPQGRVDTVLLPDGSAVFTWLEMGDGKGAAGGIYARTLTPAGELSAPLLLAPSSAARASGFPRGVALADRRVLLSHTQDSEPSRVVTQIVTLD